MSMNIDLVECKEKCCGCEACINVCPQNAISLEYDDFGYIFPKIDDNKCTSCGLCKKECSYQNDVTNLLNLPINIYAAQTKNCDILQKSASGGVFFSLAKKFLEEAGVVYGVTMEYHDGKINIFHKRIDDIENLKCLQGSKYVQSRMKKTYIDIKNDIKNNKMILFSGTPCQVAAVKKYFKKYEKIFFVDIICHGTPSQKHFHEYLLLKEKNNKIKIIDYKFRDKTLGWLGYKGKMIYLDSNGRKKEKQINSKISSYYNLFLNNTLCRESCYSCKYAQNKRVGDITIGDFWGLKETQPEILVCNGGTINDNNGVSCIFVNSEKGKYLIENYSNDIIKEKSTLNNVCKFNEQLNNPCKCNKNRSLYLNEYKKNGYKGIEKIFIKKLVIDLFKRKISNVFGRKKK